MIAAMAQVIALFPSDTRAASVPRSAMRRLSGLQALRPVVVAGCAAALIFAGQALPF
ncbi:hypothetical protein I5E68_19235 [Novosphingobium sp. YJ-S2-02]|uniref:Uncharacterized protein n=1 Tax=Novosphingobium aureum TaxID=2792964 RepID=A0A931HFY2_9SPHN|nr:hypothetical protein [Novosphingobium aureum]MBH0115082.1 hypothetical protein [Novosphingobium aureum]